MSKKNRAKGDRVSHSQPFIYMNWRRSNSHCDLQYIEETRIFTDARIIGEVACGPYQFINTVAIPADGIVPAIVVRVNNYLSLDFSPSGPKKEYNLHYHGGNHFDELAALVSLILGIRAQAGNCSRIFREDDPLGRPQETRWRPDPVLLPSLYRRPQIKRLEGSRELNEMSLMSRILKLETTEVIALVKAARLYQQALWVVDSQPELAWLLLVSAAETIASQSCHSHYDDGAVYECLPNEIRSSIEGASADIQKCIINYFRKYSRSTAKFVCFLKEFLPDRPEERPEEGAVENWSKDGFKSAFKTIYHYRSRALHDGIAFPAPMCEPPQFGEEIPLGRAMQTKGATWHNDESQMPMLIHTFEHIVRGSILKWLEKVSPSEVATPS